MPTSNKPTDRLRPPSRLLRALEAIAAAMAFAFLPELPWAGRGTATAPQLGWIAVLILSARYGPTGFLTGAIAAVAGVGIGSVLAGDGFASHWSRVASAPDLVALGACLIVSWVASGHARRQAELRERLSAAAERAAHAEATARSLSDEVEVLRARADRASTSLAFLRDVAAQLDGRDPVAAAEGAADLALLRTGALAVSIQLVDGELRRVVAFRHAARTNGLTPRELPAPDVSLPVRAGREIVGLMTLWGLGRSAIDAATAGDLDVIASWCGPALTHTGRPAETATRPIAVNL